MHREEMPKRYLEIDAKSEQESCYRDSSCADSVQEMGNFNTRELINDLKAEVDCDYSSNYERESVNAESIEQYDPSWELLSSRSFDNSASSLASS
jgi:hypothetical protein